MENNGIKISEIKCPGCGSPLKMSTGGSGFVRCEYCGGEYAVDWNRGSAVRRRAPEWQPAVSDYRPAQKPADRTQVMAFRIFAALLCFFCLCGILIHNSRKAQKAAEEEERAAISEKTESSRGIVITEEPEEISGLLGEMIKTAYGKEADAVTPEELSRIKWIADRRDFDFQFIGYSFDDPFENPEAEMIWVAFPDDIETGMEIGYENLAACAGLKKLETKQSLSSCNLRGLKLESLAVSVNTLEQVAAALDDPLSLRELSIENSIDSLEGIEKFSNLEKFSVYAADLSDVDEAIAMRQLKSFMLWNADKISDFSVLASMGGLEELSIESENLKSLEFLKRMPQLKSLALSDGQFLDLSGIETLGELQKLSITDCDKLESMAAVENLTGLKELELEKPYDCEEPSLAGLTALENLSIKSFHSCNFLQNLTGLKKLTLQSCDVPENLDLSGLTSLTELACTTFYQEMPLSFVNSISSLESVNLRGMVTYDDISGIFMLPHIKKIDISGIECEIAFDKIEENASLETLLMSGIKLYENVKVSGGGGIVYVDWDDVFLAEHTDFIARFPNLTKLEIAENEIKDLEFAGNLTKLEEIDFSDNYISEMRPLAAIPTLRWVNCKGNPISNLRVLDENVIIINE